jgi:hypothetical protein
VLSIVALNDLDQAAAVTRWDRVAVTERDLDAGVWEIEAPWDGTTRAWVGYPLAGVEITDPDTGWRFAGPLTEYELIDRPGASRVILRGKDQMARLGDWLEWPDNLSADRWWEHQTVTFESVTSTAAIIVLFNLLEPGGIGATRTMPHLVVPREIPAGAPKPITSAGDPILTRLREWFDGTPWTCRLRMVRSGDGVTGTPSLEFWAGARPDALAVVRTGQGEVRTKVAAAKATRVIAMGDTYPAGVAYERAAQGLPPEAPDPPVRYVVDAGDQARGDHWTTPYIERFESRPSSDHLTLTAEAVDAVNAARSTVTVTVTDVDLGAYGPSGTVDLGARVAVEALSADPELVVPAWSYLPVTQMRLSATPGEERREITLGTTSGNVGDIVFDAVRSVAARLGRVERRAAQWGGR